MYDRTLGINVSRHKEQRRADSNSIFKHTTGPYVTEMNIRDKLDSLTPSSRIKSLYAELLAKLPINS